MYYGTYCRLGVKVWDSPRIVLAELYTRLKPEAMTRENRGHRHAIARAVLANHFKARESYLRVMGGHL